MLTTMRRAGRRGVLLRERFGGGHQQNAGQGRHLFHLILDRWDHLLPPDGGSNCKRIA